jgi:glycosyltransferase involved in cell wall biosynthesis
MTLLYDWLKKAAKAQGCKLDEVLFTEHGRFYPDLPNRKRMVFNRLFLRERDRVVAVGKAVKQALIRNEGIPPQRIAVIYNGVRIGDFRADSRTRVEVRTELGISPMAHIGILVARLDYLKDHCTALRAAERVRRQFPDFRLVLVGEGPERPKIEAEIAKRGLSDAVLMLGLRTDVRRLLNLFNPEATASATRAAPYGGSAGLGVDVDDCSLPAILVSGHCQMDAERCLCGSPFLLHECNPLHAASDLAPVTRDARNTHRSASWCTSHASRLTIDQELTSNLRNTVMRDACRLMRDAWLLMRDARITMR